MSKNEDEITRDLQAKTDLLKHYQKELELNIKRYKEDPVEIGQYTSFLRRGIKRLEKQQKNLNKELEVARE